MRTFLVMLMLLCSGVVHAQNAPDLSEYYSSLRQPDYPSSCCGEGDAYFADKTRACTAEETLNGCALVAVITDTRPDDVRNRVHIPVGTEYVIPVSKLRKEPIPNPTDHNIVFVSPMTNQVLCYEPVAMI
jgi:hypothetical protein